MRNWTIEVLRKKASPVSWRNFGTVVSVMFYMGIVAKFMCNCNHELLHIYGHIQPTERVVGKLCFSQPGPVQGGPIKVRSAYFCLRGTESLK